MDQNFNGKVALITGGTSGIGLAISKELAKLGCKICISYSQSDKKAAIAKKELEQFTNKVLVIKSDISNEQAVIELFTKIKNQYQKLDYLINNAGIDLPQAFEDFSFKDWKKIIDINLNGKFLAIKNAIPLLKNSEDARVINISSRLSQKPLLEASAYCCSQAGIEMLTKVAALELCKYNIKVNTISPGFTKTPLTEGIYLNKEFWEKSAVANPSKRVGDPIDIANTVVFLLSSKSNYINGVSIHVNGGSHLG